jgi:hypothetical protein
MITSARVSASAGSSNIGAIAAANAVLPTTALSAMMVIPGFAGFAGGVAPQETNAKAAIVEKAVAAMGLLFIGIARIDAPNGGVMATATSTQTAKPPRSKLKVARNIAFAVLALMLLLLVWNWGSIKGQAKVGAAYGAHIACSCRYIEGRDMPSCETDMEPGMEIVSLSDDPGNKRVTASVLFLAKAVAERRGTNGCIQLNEKEIDAL